MPAAGVESQQCLLRASGAWGGVTCWSLLPKQEHSGSQAASPARRNYSGEDMPRVRAFLQRDPNGIERSDNGRGTP